MTCYNTTTVASRRSTTSTSPLPKLFDPTPHAPQAKEFGIEEMRGWYRERDSLTFTEERLVLKMSSLDETVNRILNEVYGTQPFSTATEAAILSGSPARIPHDRRSGDAGRGRATVIAARPAPERATAPRRILPGRPMLETQLIHRTLRVPSDLGDTGKSGDSAVVARQLDAALLTTGFKCSGPCCGTCPPGRRPRPLTPLSRSSLPSTPSSVITSNTTRTSSTSLATSRPPPNSDSTSC